MIKVFLAILLTGILTDNYILSKFLGICPFLGVSKKVNTAVGMSAAVIFVMVLATAVTYPINTLLVKNGMEYLQTIVFILVIAALVQLVEIILKKYMVALYNSLGIYLPLITTNCAVLGVAILVIQKGYTLMESVTYGFSTSLGFTLALWIFAGIREQLELTDLPKGMQGVPIALICAGLLAMAFMGFSGIKIG
jgi:electron transport complex protein RnfA